MREKLCKMASMLSIHSVWLDHDAGRWHGDGAQESKGTSSDDATQVRASTASSETQNNGKRRGGASGPH